TPPPPPIRGGDKDHTIIGFKPIHLHQQLVERLFPLVMPAPKPGAAMAPDSVDFVDENDAGSMFFPLIEEIAHSRGADAYEHLYEVRAADAEKGHVGFAGNRPGEQGF